MKSYPGSLTNLAVVYCGNRMDQFSKNKKAKAEPSWYCPECIFIPYSTRKPKVVTIMNTVMIEILNTFF